MWKRLGALVDAVIFALCAFVSAVIAVGAIRLLLRDDAPAGSGEKSETGSSAGSSAESSSPPAEQKAS